MYSDHSTKFEGIVGDYHNFFEEILKFIFVSLLHWIKHY